MAKAHYIQNIYLSFVRDFHDNEHDNFHKQLFDAYTKKIPEMKYEHSNITSFC